jgi:hypothetical protein
LGSVVEGNGGANVNTNSNHIRSRALPSTSQSSLDSDPLFDQSTGEPLNEAAKRAAGYRD